MFMLIAICDDEPLFCEQLKKEIYLYSSKYNLDTVVEIFYNGKSLLNDLRFDIIFLDPPYNTNYDIEAIIFILENNLLQDNGLIILETDSKEKEDKLKKINIKIDDARKYGRVKLLFLSRKG